MASDRLFQRRHDRLRYARSVKVNPLRRIRINKASSLRVVHEEDHSIAGVVRATAKAEKSIHSAGAQIVDRSPNQSASMAARRTPENCPGSHEHYRGRRSTIVGLPPSAVPNFAKSWTVVARAREVIDRCGSKMVLGRCTTFNRFAGLRTLHAHGTLAAGSFFAREPTFSRAGNAMSAYKSGRLSRVHNHAKLQLRLGARRLAADVLGRLGRGGGDGRGHELLGVRLDS